MTKQTTVRLDTALNARLVEKGQATGRSVTELVHAAVVLYLDGRTAAPTVPKPVAQGDDAPDVSPGGVPLGSKRTEAALAKDPLARAWDVNTRALRDAIAKEQP